MKVKQTEAQKAIERFASETNIENPMDSAKDSFQRESVNQIDNGDESFFVYKD